MRILIVDDSRDDRRVLRYMVEKNGHEAIEAEDGLEGLRKAKTDSPDLIISDVLMPVMDGFQFLKEVRQDPDLRTLPFIFYSSSYKEAQDVRLAQSLGADNYVIKPVEPTELWAKVAALLKVDRREAAPPGPLVGDDAEYLKRYTQVVAAKLEEKVRELERTLEDRKRAEEARRESELRFRSIFDNVLDGLFLFDVTEDGRFRIVEANPALERLTGIPLSFSAGKTLEEILPGTDARQVSEMFRRCVAADRPTEEEVDLDLPTGRRSFHTTFIPTRNESGRVIRIIGISHDITERKLAERERLENLKFLESLDIVNRTIQGIHDVDRMMSDVLKEVLAIFECDRVWLFYPCDPVAPSFRVPMEISRPEYPGAGIVKTDLPMSPDMAQNLREILESADPVTYTAGTEKPINKVSAEQFCVKSMMMGTLHPKSGKAWAFGLHQCSYPRIWTVAEKRLFQEISRRLADALSSFMAYRELRESEKRYRRITEGLTDYQYSVRVENGRAVETTQSTACATVTGYTQEEFAADPYLWISMVAPEDRELVRERVQQILAGTDTPPLEHRILRKDGALRWVCDTTILLKDAAGKLLSYDGVIKDITERKKAEQDLKESESFLGSIVENIPNMLFVKDAQALRFVRFNRAGEQLLGYSREELLGKTDSDLFPKEEADLYAARDRAMLSTNELVDIPEEPIRTRDKVERILHTKIIPILDETGKSQYLLGISEDITERKRAEKALFERDAFILRILESVDEGFIVVDREYRVVSANRAFCAMAKLPEDQAVGRHCYELIHHTDRPCFETGVECAVRQTFETGAIHSVAHTHTDATGEKRYVEIASYPITDAAGTVVTVIETITDVSERKHLGDQLRQAQKMEAIGTLAGGVAHDFNNILTAIIGYGTLAKMKMPADDPHRAYLDQILASSERATHLTQSLLAFSRKQVINPKLVNLNDIVRNIEKMLRRLIGEDIDLSMQLSDSDLVVMADRGQIDQVLMNLVTNARDAMPHGGMLAITTHDADVDEDFAKAYAMEKPGKHALLVVSDNGCGMDEATRGKLFEPFFTTKEPGSGTGLGLAIVYGIVKQHHGNISVNSEPGKGTTFKILLPLLAAVLDEPRSVAVEPPRGGNETILLAEDDSTVREIIKTILHDYGYQVIEAADGREAIDLYREHHSHIDLLIVDVIMPRKSGREVCDAVLSISPDAKVLFLSGYTADIIHKKGIFEEGLNFMSKPVNPADLGRKIRAMLDGKSGVGGA